MNVRSGCDRGGTRERVGRLVAATAFLLLAGAAAAHLALADPQPGFTSQSARIAFVDRQGDAALAPKIMLEGTYPGMHPQRTLVALRNVGDVHETYTVSAEIDGGASPSLDDVLVVTVRDQATGAVVYTGSLSKLTFRGAATLAPGGSAGYVFQVSWPDTIADDSAYQGQSTTFSLLATADLA